MRRMKTAILAATAALLTATSVSAHVGLAITGTAAPGSTNLFGFGPGHGCGTSPTVALHIQIPAGIEAVKPVAKPGWNIQIVSDADGNVTEIHFTDGNLPNEWYDQFWIRARINADVPVGTGIYFPIVQDCVEGANNWLAIPEPGGPEPEEPAPGFTVLDAAEADHDH
jgi:uncharacterized protein YcnI